MKGWLNITRRRSDSPRVAYRRKVCLVNAGAHQIDGQGNKSTDEITVRCDPSDAALLALLTESRLAVVGCSEKSKVSKSSHLGVIL